MSQEWDEVVHEFCLMMTRLDAFRDDLLAAADGGELTHTQREFARDSTEATGDCLLRLLELLVAATAAEAEQSETQE